jgi:uncharacterized membrane protein
MGILAAVYEPDALTLYNLVLFLHIASAIVAFGVVFAYPLFVRVARAGDPANLPYFHRAQGYVGARLITGGATMVLLTGIVIVASSDVYKFSAPFVSAGLLIVILLLGMGGAVFAPLERRMADLSARDVAAAQGGEVRWSPEYLAAQRRYDVVSSIGMTLVLLAVLLMVVKPL